MTPRRKRLTTAVALILAYGALLAGCAAPKPKKNLVYLDHTPVLITEVHYSPSKEQGKGAKFIELANVSKTTVDLSGWQVTGAKRLKLPAGTTLGPRETLVICSDRDVLRTIFKANATAVFKGKLKSKETIRVEDPEGRVADEVKYNAKDDQVKRASNTGLSLHRRKFKSTEGQGIWNAKMPSPGSIRPRRS
jgi:hypothetical protein